MFAFYLNILFMSSQKQNFSFRSFNLEKYFTVYFFILYRSSRSQKLNLYKYNLRLFLDMIRIIEIFVNMAKYHCLLLTNAPTNFYLYHLTKSINFYDLAPIPAYRIPSSITTYKIPSSVANRCLKDVNIFINNFDI